MKKSLINITFLTIIFLAIFVYPASAVSSYDFNCETLATVNNFFEGEVKYKCLVKNTGDSFLELLYVVQPEQNPIDPHGAVGFHPQPSKIFLEAGEEQPIVGFEVPPKVSIGEKEITYTRNILIQSEQAQTKQATITTIVTNQAPERDAKVFGKITDSETGKPIANVNIFFKYKKFEEKLQITPNGDYSANLPSFEYVMVVQANGYELFSENVDLKNNEELKKDIELNKAKEKGSYSLIKEVKPEPGAWEGVWRAAVSVDGNYFGFGMGGVKVKPESSGGYFYLFDNSGKEILKKETANEVRGIDISPDNSLVAVSLGYNQQKDSPSLEQEYEKVLVYTKSGELLWKKFLKKTAFYEVKFSPDGKYIAIGDAEGYVYLLNAADGTEIWNKFTRGQVRAIKFYDDNSHLLVGNGEGYMYLFDINGNKKWKTYIHSWPYGFIATTSGNEFSAAGGHMGYLHFLDKDGKDLWTYEAEGGFRWAEIGLDGSYVVGGTRSEIALLNSQGKVLWRGYDSVSGATTKDKKYIISGNQRGEFELRNTKGTILWEYRTGLTEPGKDVRFSYISDDASYIVGAARTGEVYFFKGEISPGSPETYIEEGNENVPGPKYPPVEKRGFFGRIKDFFRNLFGG